MRFFGCQLKIIKMQFDIQYENHNNKQTSRPKHLWLEQDTSNKARCTSTNFGRTGLGKG